MKGFNPILLIFVFAAVSIHAGLPEDKAGIKRAELRLKRDAARLALRLEAQGEDLRLGSIQIPASKTRSIYDALLAIHRSDLDAAQKISTCRIHALPSPSIDRFVLVFDRQAKWANLLRQGITETNDVTFNDLLDEYDLAITNHNQWDATNDAVTIRSAQPYNMAALSEKFRNINGVSEIRLQTAKSDGNDIKITRTAKGWRVEYVLKWDNCMDECESTHSWIFEVSNNSEVKFIKEVGESVPDWIRCEEEEMLVSRDI